jgi:oxygen-dependent protoporphyrinogen oxidase
LCESAANGMLNSLLLEEMARKIDIKIIPAQKQSKKRFIFRKKLRTWPLSLLETVTLGARFIASSRMPKIRETVEEWGRRTLGKAATDFLLSPALQGIYAGSIEDLSATLILSRFFKRPRKSRPKVRGLVSFPRGMGEFCERLKVYLESKGVKIHFNSEYQISPEVTCVVATSAPTAAVFLEKPASQISALLKNIEMISLVSVTAFFIEEPKAPKGFGALFPRTEKFRTLGVLFNNYIFPHRSSLKSETYILGGARDPAILELSDSDLMKVIAEERFRFLKSKISPVGFRVQRWKKTLPHYTVELEEILKLVRAEEVMLEKRGIYLHGNYLGGIGLSQILERSAKLVERLIPYE